MSLIGTFEEQRHLWNRARRWSGGDWIHRMPLHLYLSRTTCAIFVGRNFQSFSFSFLWYRLSWSLSRALFLPPAMLFRSLNRSLVSSFVRWVELSFAIQLPYFISPNALFIFSLGLTTFLHNSLLLVLYISVFLTDPTSSHPVLSPLHPIFSLALSIYIYIYIYIYISNSPSDLFRSKLPTDQRGCHAYLCSITNHECWSSMLSGQNDNVVRSDFFFNYLLCISGHKVNDITLSMPGD